MVEMLKRQKEEEEQQEKTRKILEKQRVEQVLQENDLLLQKKELEKQKEREYELKLAADYIRMEEAKDAARKKQLEDLSNNIKARMKFFNDTAKADMLARTQEEERRIKKYQEV